MWQVCRLYGTYFCYRWYVLELSVLVFCTGTSCIVFCSKYRNPLFQSLCKKTISGVIFSYGIYECFFVLTVVPYLVWEVVSGYQTTASLWSLLMLANPFIYLAEFVELTMTGSSFIESGWLIHPAQRRALCTGFWYRKSLDDSIYNCLYIDFAAVFMDCSKTYYADFTQKSKGA